MAAKRRRSEKEIIDLTAGTGEPTYDLQHDAPPTARRRSIEPARQIISKCSTTLRPMLAQAALVFGSTLLLATPKRRLRSRTLHRLV